jgi:hypothetical protein
VEPSKQRSADPADAAKSGFLPIWTRCVSSGLGQTPDRQERPLAEKGCSLHPSRVSEQPTVYIHAAFSSLGINVQSLDIAHYDPAAFGNLVANADTSVGRLNIAYDRGFHVDGYNGATEQPTLEQIIEALEQHKRAARNGS